MVDAAVVPRRSLLELLPFECAAHRTPERTVPNILNNEKVFTVFQDDLVPRSTFSPRIRCVLSAVGMGWLTYLYQPRA